MTHHDIHFVDPTIPGVSGRDLTERAIESSQSVGGGYRVWRKDFALRKGLSRLDREQLRDLGIDRGAA